MSKKLLYTLLFLIYSSFLNAQEPNRIERIKNQLTILAVEEPGLTENVKTEINVTNVNLSNFLLAISDIHNLNINVSPELNQINIVNNFSNVTVADLLVFLCKEYSLTIDFTGNILSVKKYYEPEPVPEKRIIPISYSPNEDLISLDLNNDKLYEVFKKIINESGKNLVFSPGIENKKLTVYMKDTPFESAMQKLAYANYLFVEKTEDNFYLFEDDSPSSSSNNNTPVSKRQRRAGFNYEILDSESKLLSVDFTSSPVEDIVYNIGEELGIDIFTASPLSQAGTITLKAKTIYFDQLLSEIFKVQGNISSGNGTNPQGNGSNNTIFTYKKEGNLYFFGTKDQLSVREVEIVHLQHRSVELLADPSGKGNTSNRRAGNIPTGNYNNYGNNYQNSGQFDNYSNRHREQVATPQNNSFGNYNSKAEALISILPDEIKEGLDIKIDFEMNSFYVNGTSEKIKRFKTFIAKIDKPVPVVLIEVMIIEVRRSATVETGVSWGIGDEPVVTQGSIFPSTNMTLSSKTINKVIGGFDGFGSFNLGKVVPNFYATIKAMEANGNLKIRSTPKLSTLNGHRATFSNGQTSYYAVTQRNIYGTDNPQTSEITNYVPIDAELGLTIKPLVSGDGQVTLDIFVIQSDFGSRIEENAPPNINSREFSSIIRVEDQDIVVLGGLEEQVKDDSGTGVPLLSRIPIIKWLFSSRRREDSKSKLTVLIKPTIIY